MNNSEIRDAGALRDTSVMNSHEWKWSYGDGRTQFRHWWDGNFISQFSPSEEHLLSHRLNIQMTDILNLWQNWFYSIAGFTLRRCYLGKNWENISTKVETSWCEEIIKKLILSSVDYTQDNSISLSISQIALLPAFSLRTWIASCSTYSFMPSYRLCFLLNTTPGVFKDILLDVFT